MATSPVIQQPIELIPAYRLPDLPLEPNNEFGGYYPESGTFRPYAKYVAVYEVMDSITAAAEAGFVDRNRWVSQFFANQEIFIEFMQEFSEYDDNFRVVERWYRALFHIADAGDEEGFIHCEEMVEKLLEQAEETGQVVL